MKKILNMLIISVMMFSSVSITQGNECNSTLALQSQKQHQTQTFDGVSSSSSINNVNPVNDVSSSINDTGNSSINNSFNDAKPIRYLPIPSNIQYQSLSPQMFARPIPDKGSRFISSVKIIEMMGAWNLNEMSDDDFSESDVIIDATYVGKSDINPDDITTVTFCIQGSDEELFLKKSNTKTIAVGSVSTKSKDVNTPELFYTLAKKAKSLGASNIIIMSEGIEVTLKSSGWGIGASYNYARVGSDGTDSGSVGAGGTGYSRGKAFYNKKPYLTFSFLK